MNEGLGGVIGNRSRAHKYVMKAENKPEKNENQVKDFENFANKPNVIITELDHQDSNAEAKKPFTLKSNIQDLK